MSSIRIVKGYPKSLIIHLLNDGTDVNLNDGTWTVSVSLPYQVKGGPVPFPITAIPNGNTVQIDLDSTQTSQLSHLGSGYVLVVNASKSDNTVFLENSVQVNVTNGL
jgi:hypothetical protein